VVVLIHGNLGLADPFGPQLRDFTEDIARLGYLAALPAYYPTGQSDLRDTDIHAHVPVLTAEIKYFRTRSDADSDRLGLIGFSLGGGIAMSYIAASPAGTVNSAIRH
jgi:dienelactone hydrolase